MAVASFSFNDLAEMDHGRLRVLFEQALLRVTEDVRDRPADKSKRKVQLTVEVTPAEDVVDDDGVCLLDVNFQVKETIPARRSRDYSMAAAKGRLLFNEVSPDDVRQRTLDDIGKPSLIKGSDDNEEAASG